MSRYQTEEEREKEAARKAQEQARELRAQLARMTATTMRKDAAELLAGAATETDAAKCEARLAVGNALVRAAMKFERGDLS